MSKANILLCSLLLTLFAGGCERDTGSSPPVAEQVTATRSWDEFVHLYIEAHLAAHPAWAVVQGRHEFDGQLPDWSRAGIEAEIDRLHAAREAAMAFDAATMSAGQLYQREYLVSRLDHDLFWTEKARWPFRNPQFYIGWMNDSLESQPLPDARLRTAGRPHGRIRRIPGSDSASCRAHTGEPGDAHAADLAEPGRGRIRRSGDLFS